MTETFIPKIAPQIWEHFPDFFIASIVMRQGENNSPVTSLTDEYPDKPDKSLIEEHLQSWAEAYRILGEKHKKTPSSAYALIKRYEKTGEMPVINPVVDLYNRISVEFGIPAGGEDIDRYTGIPFLKISDGTEPFETSKSGEMVTEHPRLGEVVWCDDLGVTCRRWNWRQGPRTRIDEHTSNFWFVLEALPPFDKDIVKNATLALIEDAKKLCPQAVFTAKLISKNGEQEISL
jgi:DNA/RNA-binding domain of Phe-tRNA-synthetase-like protein